MTGDLDAKPVLSGYIYDSKRFPAAGDSGSIDLGLLASNDRERIYQMAESSPSARDAGPKKPMGQTYYEEVEALKATGVSNADAIRQVADKNNKKENAVRTGIHQYKAKHVSGNGATAPARRARQQSPNVEDYIAQARAALETALQLIDREVDEARTAYEAAKSHYEDVEASVKERKADIEKKLKGLE